MELFNKKTALFLLLIMAIAVFFRFYKLSEIPPGLYPDVAINGNDAIYALNYGDFRVFYPENNGREGLFMNLIALSFYFFGISIWAIKIVPAIIGVLTLLGIYLMTKELFKKISNSQLLTSNKIKELDRQNQIGNWKLEIRNYSAEIIALLSTFFLSVSFWHVNFSRLGFRAIMVPFILVWSFYFLFKAIELAKNAALSNSAKEKPHNTLYIILATSYFILSGLVFGLGFHTYISFRVAPLIIGIIFLIEIYNFWQAKKSSTENPQFPVPSSQFPILPWLLFFFAIIIAASPMILYFYNNPQDFMGRTGQVSVLASEQPLKGLLISTAKSLSMFNFWGDCNWRHNLACKPALPAPVGILFLIGFVWATYQIWNSVRQRAPWRRLSSAIPNETPCFWSSAQISIFLLSWFFAMLLPEIMTNEGLPHSLRAIGAIPAVYIFAGIGGWWIIYKIKSKNEQVPRKRKEKVKTSLKVLGILFCIWLTAYSYDLYFVQWGKNPVVKGAFTQNFVDIGNYLNNLPPETKKYVVINENGVPVPYPNGIPMPAQTIVFIEKTAGKEDKTFYMKTDELKLIQGINPDISYPIVFVLMKYDEAILNFLKEKIPQGEIKEINGIWTFQVQS